MKTGVYYLHEGGESQVHESHTTNEVQARVDKAIRMTAPGTSLRHALDMIIAGHMGALICVGDEEAVLAAGNDGFPLNISFTANRLFELSKMDGAIVIDKGVNQILRANYHLNPDPGLPTSETGMRHRTAARMSLLTKAMVISVSERRQVINVFVNGRGHELKTVAELMGSVNQLVLAMQATRQALDHHLMRLTTLELENQVTLSDLTETFYLFEVLTTAGEELHNIILQLGSEGRTVQMQHEEFLGNLDDEYTLMIRDYAKDSSEENAATIRQALDNTANSQLHKASNIARLLGYNDRHEDSVMTPLGLRTLSNVSVVRKGVADRIVDEYGSLQDLMGEIKDNPARLEEAGVRNPSILADSLYRMWGKHI
ncbi:MAG: DNA integrity scanning diadenylate cyclase DisA [Coriobacteriales bacterium]|nr:DNA integrity scanning diadenylate cyclase DisA [Coriobacteriales bacterium]